MPSNFSDLAINPAFEFSLDDLSATRFQQATRNPSDLKNFPELQCSTTIETVDTTHTERSSTPSRRRPSFFRQQRPSTFSTFGTATVAIAAPVSPELQSVALGKIKWEPEEPVILMHGRHSNQWLFKGWRRAFVRMLS